MFNKKIINYMVRKSIIIFIVLLITFTICSLVYAQDKITLKFGDVFTPSHNVNIFAEWMKKELDKRTNGRVELKIYPNSILGNETEMIEGVLMGTLDFTPTGGPLGSWVEKVKIIDMPYLIDSKEHFVRCYIDPGPVGKALEKEILKESGLKVLGWFGQGFRITTCRTKPIMKLEDFKGVKIRTHENPLVVATFRALGAEAVPMAWGEVYTSLKTGIIDAVESPPSVLGPFGMCEVAPYISHTNHFFLITALVMSEKKFNSLPSDIQEVILDLGKEGQYLILDFLDENIQAGLDQMRALETLETYPDLEPFKEAVKSVIKEFGEKYGATDLIEEMEKLR